MINNKFIDPVFPWEEIHQEVSEHQWIQVMRDTLINARALYLDGRCQVHTEDSHRYHECLSVLPCLYTKDPPARALILGGGDGICANMLLKMGVEDITLVDIDPQVIQVSLKYFKELNENSLLSDNVKIYYEDAFEYVQREQKPYDLIIADYTDPLSNFYCQRLYTVEHINAIMHLLKPTGAFAIQVIDCATNPLPFWCMAKTLGYVFVAGNITPYRVYLPYMDGQQGGMIISKRGLKFREIPEWCKFLSNSAHISITSLAKDEYDIDVVDVIPVSTLENLAYYNLIFTPYQRTQLDDI